VSGWQQGRKIGVSSVSVGARDAFDIDCTAAHNSRAFAGRRLEKMAELNDKIVLEAIRPVRDPELGRSLVELGEVPSITVESGRVTLHVRLATPTSPHRDQIESDLRAALVPVPGIRELVIDWNWEVNRPPPTRGGGRENLAPGARNVVLVGSGKGGVGKSTVAVNLAVALAQSGARVGLLDADIYGPSIPIMLGVRNAKPKTPDGKLIVPVEAFGLKLISIGFFVDPEQAMVWRGPMLHGAIVQFFRDVQWGDLDYLILDLPPGTGDIQLTIAQQVKVSGAVVVTTPQDLALADAIKAKAMFDKVDIPVLGIVENMSYFSCPHCHTRTEIFDHGGGAAAAEKLGVPFLGEVPLVLSIREGGDAGKPIMAAAPDSAEAKALRNVATNVATQVALANMGGAPTVVGPTEPRRLVQIKL
jgi:ATP-binding protein involved in chromosome partitioning